MICCNYFWRWKSKSPYRDGLSKKKQLNDLDLRKAIRVAHKRIMRSPPIRWVKLWPSLRGTKQSRCLIDYHVIPDCFVPPKKQNCNMFIICDIKSIKERSLTYHPGEMSEISRGLREAIPPDSSVSTSLIPEGLHKINAQMKYPVSSLRDEK